MCVLRGYYESKVAEKALFSTPSYIWLTSSDDLRLEIEDPVLCGLNVAGDHQCQLGGLQVGPSGARDQTWIGYSMYSNRTTSSQIHFTSNRCLKC